MKVWIRKSIVPLLTWIVVAACGEPQQPAVSPAVVEIEVAILLSEWAEAISDNRLDDFKALYADREGFLWIERGAVLYRSVEEIAIGIDEVAGSGAVIENTLGAVDIAPLGSDAAAFSVALKSTVTAGESRFTFDGIFTGVAIREEGGWRLFQGHLSERADGA
ncbi:MAG: nuclear transport factor 2 family protein [Pseudomonadota bacterium]